MTSAGLPAGPGVPTWTPPSTYLDRLATLESAVEPVAPSGDTTGATDPARINAALLAHKQVRGLPGGVYYLSSYIEPVSDCLLEHHDHRRDVGHGCDVDRPERPQRRLEADRAAAAQARRRRVRRRGEACGR
jgi:uncharacterized protein (DUF58 family)